MPTDEKLYTVTWTEKIWASDANDAARQARERQLDLERRQRFEVVCKVEGFDQVHVVTLA